MRVVFAGTPTPALPTLQRILDSEHDLVAVISRPDARQGRGRQKTPSPVAQFAHDHDLPLLQPAKATDPDFVAALQDLAPDVCVIVAYGALLRAEVLQIPLLGWVNLHFSLLPAWRGAAPVQRAIWAGEEITGATTFRLDEGMDTGPYFGVVTETISPTDTTGDLLERLSVSGAELMIRTLAGLATGEVQAADQPADNVSLAPKVTKEEARVNWSLPAAAVDRQIRACTPAPGAWTELADQRVKVFPVTVPAPTTNFPAAVGSLTPGQLEFAEGAAWVGTGAQPVLLGLVQPSGKKRMAGSDWLRGVRGESTLIFH